MTDPFEKAKEEAEKLRLRKLFEKKQSEKPLEKPIEIDKTVEAKLAKEHSHPPALEVPKEESKHAKILREHGGLESNIPIHHEYWRIRP